jgi:hypothetical protein
MRRTLSSTLAVSIYLVVAMANVAHAAPRASRPAEKNCQWKTFHSRSLGVSLLVENCVDPYAHYVYSVVGNRIEQHRPADDRTYGGPLMMEFYTKPAEQSIEKAIAARFVARLPREARLSCRVVPYHERRDTRLRYTIMPTGAYAKKIYAELAQYPRDFGCGDYGAGQSDMYFEYHPAESLTRFVFVDAGQDEPLFDQESIRFER